MSDVGSSVTLIFYRVGKDWYKGGEPLLNLVAAAAQGSAFTHVELALGEAAGEGGRMKNVLRVFNDAIGVELAERTGINPSYSYLSLGCSKAAEEAMLRFARRQVGKPFSPMGMARALVWPRKTDESSWFCAELVAACLQAGGLMSHSSSPGAATPSSLYKLYKECGAVAANPCTLRRQFQEMAHVNPRTFNLLGLKGGGGGHSYSAVPQQQQQQQTLQYTNNHTHAHTHSSRRNMHEPPAHAVPRRSTTPPRMSFKRLATAPVQSAPRHQLYQQASYTIPLTLSSLDMRR